MLDGNSQIRFQKLEIGCSYINSSAKTARKIWCSNFAMKIAIVFILAAGTLIFAGCSSTVRTLEYKDGRVLMTEDGRDGGTPSTWELKEVSSSVEVNTLRKTGWKFEDVVHHEGGADTFLMKRKVNLQTAALPPFRPMLITTFGTNTTPDGTWQIAISDATLDLSRSIGVSDGPEFKISSTIGVPGWTAHTGWFVFIESDSRVWAYDGDHPLWLSTVTRSGNGVMWTNYVSPRFPCAVPSDVFSRLSEPAQKAISSHD